MGAVLTVGGVATIYTSGHSEQPWRILLTLAGLVLAGLGGWCLLWFIGIEGVVGLSRTKHAERNVKIVVRSLVWLVFAASVLLTYLLGRA